MLKVHRLPDMDRIEREASEWIARLNADDVSTGDRVRFDEWRDAHSLHARTYDELAAKNPDFKLIYESWQKFLADSNLWFRIAENTLDNYRFTMSAQPR